MLLIALRCPPAKGLASKDRVIPLRCPYPGTQAVGVEMVRDIEDELHWEILQ